MIDKTMVIGRDLIHDRVRRLGHEIELLYPEDEELVVLVVLKGAFIFAADLVRAIERPLTVEFIRASSYGDQQESSGLVEIEWMAEFELEGKHVLLVDDILDTGLTLETLRKVVRKTEPKSVKTCVLLDKGKADRPATWVGFDIPDQFVIGYGLDNAGEDRHLGAIYALNG